MDANLYAKRPNAISPRKKSTVGLRAFQVRVIRNFSFSPGANGGVIGVACVGEISAACFSAERAILFYRFMRLPMNMKLAVVRPCLMFKNYFAGFAMKCRRFDRSR